MSAIYRSGSQLFATALLDWTVPGAIVAMLVGTAYTPNFLTDNVLGVVPSPAMLTSIKPLLNPTVVNGVCGADALIWANLVTTDGVAAVLLLHDDGSGVPANFPMIAYLDDGFGLLYSPTHEDTTIAWSTSGILIL